MSHPNGYSATQITLHWLTALGVIVAFFTHDAMLETVKTVRDAGGDPIPTVHTIAGFLVFVLVLVRLWLRRRRGAPAPQGTALEKKAVELGHGLLYLLLVAVPLMGAISWFGGVENLGGIHGLAGKGLMIVALGHAAMAIWHQYGKKDGTLTRMMRPDK